MPTIFLFHVKAFLLSFYHYKCLLLTALYYVSLLLTVVVITGTRKEENSPFAKPPPTSAACLHEPRLLEKVKFCFCFIKNFHHNFLTFEIRILLKTTQKKFISKNFCKSFNMMKNVEKQNKMLKLDFSKSFQFLFNVWLTWHAKLRFS